jgi:Toprim-like
MEVPKELRVYEDHGVIFGSRSDTEFVGDCCFCGKEDHFYANSSTAQWDCKSCGESGNRISFLQKIVDLHHTQTSPGDWRRLAGLRGLPETAFRRWQLGWNGDMWLIPCHSNAGRVHDIRLWNPRTGRVRSTSGCKVQLFAADQLAIRERMNESVWICEGEWDTIALAWLFRKTKRGDVAVGVPGAGTFKKEWVSLFNRREVNLCHDNDDAGRKGAQKAAGLLAGVAKRVRAVGWRADEPNGYDVSDLIINLRNK